MHAWLTFLQKDNAGSLFCEIFCRTTMQPPLFQSKLKIFLLLHRLDHLVLTLYFFKYTTDVIKISQTAR